MTQIEKIFEKVNPVNHSRGSSYLNNKIRIKDNRFSIKSIYKIVEHLNWMKNNMSLCKTKIIIDSDYLADQSILTLFESIIYFVIDEWKFIVSYRFEIKEHVLGYEIFKNSILYKYNNRDINIENYISEYKKEICIQKSHFRKLCENIEKNRKSEFLSITMHEIDIFFKCFGINTEYRDELTEVIVEIIDNGLNHSTGDCILNINVVKDLVKNDNQKYKYIDVSVIVIDDISFGSEIKRYIREIDKSEYSEKNKIILEAYKKHEKHFDSEYNIDAFSMISAYQKYVTTRKNNATGGTGLTTLIRALIDKASENFCYAISGSTNLIFKKEFLNLTEDELIGFNETNNYIEDIPNKNVVNVNNYDMNVNIYNLQFILKEIEE